MKPEFWGVADGLTDKKGGFASHSLLIQYLGPLQIRVHCK